MLKSFPGWCLGVLILMASTSAAARIAIIPKPQRLEPGAGSYRLDAHSGIVAPGDARGREIASFLREAIHTQTGIKLAEGRHANGIVLAIDPSVQGNEAYRLSVTPQAVTIRAATDKGLFWGAQTLRQLLPLGKHAVVDIPSVHIEDAPAYAYRGVMLDVARHFYPVDFIKRQLDLLSYYKINVFHWHLTDDQAWRIQIKRYPKLTSVGAWRTEADGSRYGGFYTQVQIRDVVDYARRRNITVIPEIEMPGHSTAALVAHPILSCTRPPLAVPTTWGVFKDIDCVGKESTFVFLQHVLDEVIALFPSSRIHIGGDEAPKDRWKDCASCQKLMQAQGLADEEGLQSYFIRRIQRYLTGKGRTLVGWDEILEGGADKNAIIEIWRGDDEARKALENGNRVIIAGPFYLDSPLDKLTLRDVHDADIAGSSATLYSPSQPQNAAMIASHRAQILGAEAPLWSERANPFNAESKLYPRVLALAENLWSGGAHDDAAYADFQQRLQASHAWLDAQHVAYGPEDHAVVAYTIGLNARGDGWLLRAQRGFSDLHNHYTTDGTSPNAQSPSFDDVVDVLHAGTLKVAPFRQGLRYDDASSFTLHANLALGKPMTFAHPASPKYAKEDALVDGVTGSADFHDGLWAGFQDNDLDATVDLQKDTAIHSIDIGFLQDIGSRILPPRQVTFLASGDGLHWTSLRVEPLKSDLGDAVPSSRRIVFNAGQPLRARYLRLVANRYTVLPVGFPGGDRNTWLFADEILVH